MSLLTAKIFLICFIFLFALSIRLWNFDGMGRTWDEDSYVDEGYKYYKLAKRGDFSDPFWYTLTDHPPLARYLFGVASVGDIKEFNSEGNPIFRYDYTFARLVSTIASSLTAVLVFLIGYKYFNKFVGLTSAVIFSMIPFFIGFAHTATLEAILMFVFTLAVYSYLEALSNFKKKNIIFAGVSTGFALLTKLTNLMLIPLYITFIAVETIVSRNFNKEQMNKTLSIIPIIIITLVTAFILWPMPWFNAEVFLATQERMRFSNLLSPPEVFFGRLILVPLPYYFIMFAITTPVILLLLGIIGGYEAIKLKKTQYLLVLVWFIFPFLQSFYPLKQHGVRYIIEIYAPFALLCGIGLEYFLKLLPSKTFIKILVCFGIFIYLMIIILKINPYYLDYFNELVGGPKNVYQNKLFLLGWWGQGNKEAFNFIRNDAKKVSTVAIDGPQPEKTVPKYENLEIKYYDKGKSYDYIVVPYFSVVRLGFDEDPIKASYNLVYTVYVDGAEIIHVYKNPKSP